MYLVGNLRWTSSGLSILIRDLLRSSWSGRRQNVVLLLWVSWGLEESLHPHTQILNSSQNCSLAAFRVVERRRNQFYLVSESQQGACQFPKVQLPGDAAEFFRSGLQIHRLSQQGAFHTLSPSPLPSVVRSKKEDWVSPAGNLRFSSHSEEKGVLGKDITKSPGTARCPGG